MHTDQPSTLEIQHDLEDSEGSMEGRPSLQNAAKNGSHSMIEDVERLDMLHGGMISKANNMPKN
jgi:hypothetical protein